MRSKRLFSAGQLFAIAIMIVIMICCFFPFIWMILNSFRTSRELFTKPLGIPSQFDAGIFVRAWRTAHLGRSLRNSLVVTGISVIIIVMFSSLAAYPLARVNFRGRNVLYLFIICGQMVSAQIILVPLFVLFNNMHLLGNLSSVILAVSGSNVSFATLLFTNAFREIPRDIDDSTEIDGCSRIRYFFTILMPLAAPIYASVIIFQALFVWNDYLYSLTFLTKNNTHTITLELKNFFSEHAIDWPGLFAALTTVVVPILFLYLFLQKYFIKGLTAGAVKG